MSGRVSLRLVKRSDLPLIETWYEEARAAAYAERPLQQRFEEAKAAGCDLQAIVDKEREIVGLLDYRVDDPAEGWVTNVLLTLAAGRRGWGYGSEAVRQLEEKHKRSRFLAQIDVRSGLGLYFWLRLGYRPAHPSEVFWRPSERNAIIAMVRDFTAS